MAYSTKAPTPATTKRPLPTLTACAPELLSLPARALVVAAVPATVVLADVTTPTRPAVDVARENLEVVVEEDAEDNRPFEPEHAEDVDPYSYC